MQISSLQLNNFRCFKSLDLNFDKSIVYITGHNGIGKTSILEALHYCCYLKSFKTHAPKELIHLQENSFSISSNIVSEISFDNLQVKLTGLKKTVKLNQKQVTSFKELYNIYKAVTITENDLKIVQSGPLARRSFIDQIITLIDPLYATILRKYKQILDNRNALLIYYKNDLDSYHLWTSQLFQVSQVIQKRREQVLQELLIEIQKLTKDVLGFEYDIDTVYHYSRPYFMKEYDDGDIDTFLKSYPNLLNSEIAQKRSLFGAHLDDFKIIFQDKLSRVYASRGQQKLIVFLLKLAKLKYISQFSQQNNLKQNAILLIDDFFTDFDSLKSNNIINLVSNLASQIILTSAISQNSVEKQLLKLDAQFLDLNSYKFENSFSSSKAYKADISENF